MDDANHIMDAQMGVRSVPGVGDWAKRLSVVVVSGQLHDVEKLLYSKGPEMPEDAR